MPDTRTYSPADRPPCWVWVDDRWVHGRIHAWHRDHLVTVPDDQRWPGWYATALYTVGPGLQHLLPVHQHRVAERVLISRGQWAPPPDRPPVAPQNGAPAQP